MIYPFQSTDLRNFTILSFKTGDVTGDDVLDYVYLVGQKVEAEAAFTEKVGLAVYDGWKNQLLTNEIEQASGYGTRLFLGNFTTKQQLEILAVVDSEVHGVCNIANIYTIKEGKFELVFSSAKFNETSVYKVDFKNRFKAEVTGVHNSKTYLLDIGRRKKAYTDAGIYNETGRVIKPAGGKVLGLGKLLPLVSEFDTGLYHLLAYQRIIGLDNADILGTVLTYLKWDGKEFIQERTTVSIIPN